MPRRYVAVCGASEATTTQLDAAREVGRLLAGAGAVVINGGLGGVSAAASEGAANAGGTVVGLLPGIDREGANEHLSVSLPTGMGQARNVLIVTAAGDHIAFSPNTQSGVTPKAGTWQRWVVTKGSVRFDDDAGNGPDMSWDSLVNGHGGETIEYVQVQAGNTGAAIGSTSHVRNVTMEASGAEATFASYTFGS